MSTSSLPTRAPVAPGPVRFAVRGAVPLGFRCAGPAQAPPVVLVPGFAQVAADRWGDPALAAAFAPSAAGDRAFARWWARSCRMALTPEGVLASLVRRADLDVRAHVRAVQAPTLVVHRTGDRVTPVGHGRWLAAHLPAARLLEPPGDDHLWWLPDPAQVADPILRFTEEHAR